MINESKSFDDQIELFKKADYLNEYWNMSYYLKILKSLN